MRKRQQGKGAGKAVRDRAARVLVALVAAAGLAAPAAGQSVESVSIRPDLEVVHLGSEVSVEIDGDTRVARFEIQERFRNRSGRVMEADYLYPVPSGAVFTDLSLFSGETELRGEMLPADRARGIYEEIVRRRKDPALVEAIGNGLIRARVFPIEPGDTRKIILRYTQVLPRDGDLVRLTYPRTRSALVPVGQPRAGEVRSERRPALVLSDPPLAMRIRVTGAGRFGDPVSPTHALDISRPAGELEIRAESARPTDFELLLPMLRSEIGANLLVHSPDPEREEGYFLLLVTPPPYEGGERIPRDLTLVLDTSGSMSGHKLAQARAALRQLLRGLDGDDRFRLITFASVVREWRPDWSAGDAEAVERAIEWLDTRDADGSTNIQGALERALEPEAAGGQLSQVLFLTDGLPTVAETDPERIADAAARLRDGERLFAFGVGEDVNTYLLDRLVEGGRGSVSYVAPDESVEAAIGTLARRIGTPALSGLSIADAPVALEQLHPSPLPDLFHGDELMLLGRYRGDGAGRLMLEGERRGDRVRLSFDVDFVRRESDNDFLPRLWASRKAGALTAHLRLHGPDAETIEEIRELGLRYGILTEYTSYLVQEPGMRLEQVTDQVRRLVQAPARQTGGEAFRRARADADMREARSLDAADKAMAAAPNAGAWRAEPGEGGLADTPPWQRIGRRIFHRTSDGWRDARHEAGGREIAIAPGSDAWFELLGRIPGLREAAALGDGVIIAGEALSLRLEPGGRDSLDAGEWRAIERAFAAER